MRSNEFQNDEGDAVSPVIATILMVAITVVLAGVLYVWASSLAEGNTGGSLTFYQFDAEGDVGAITTGTADPLVRITMTQGVAINWATVDVKISINNGAPITCDNPGNEGGASCALIEFGDSTDSEWSVGDGVTVVESGQDLCNAVCSVKVTITDVREGRTIDESSAAIQGGTDGAGDSSSNGCTQASDCGENGVCNEDGTCSQDGSSDDQQSSGGCTADDDCSGNELCNPDDGTCNEMTEDVADGECSDGIDNDNDGHTDRDDSDCQSDSPILLNEISYTGTTNDPCGSGEYEGFEWIELHNPSSSSVDVGGYVLQDDDDLSTMTINASTTISSGGYLVLCVESTFSIYEDSEVVLFDENGLFVMDSPSLPPSTRAYPDSENYFALAYTAYDDSWSGTGHGDDADSTPGWANDNSCQDDSDCPNTCQDAQCQ